MRMTTTNGGFGRRQGQNDHGGLTALIFAAREGDLESARILVEAGADVNQTSEYGWTPLLTAIQNRYYELAMYLLDQGADPNIANKGGWVEGVTFEWSRERTLEVMRLLIDLGADVNAQDTLDYRTALMGAAHKGHTEGVQLLVDHGADLSLRDIGSRDSIHALAGVTWQAVDYADGLVRVGVQSAIGHPETATLIRELMIEQGIEVPPEGRTLDSICVVDLCKKRVRPVFG
jgi:ankyrin repeat protein